MLLEMEEVMALSCVRIQSIYTGSRSLMKIKSNAKKAKINARTLGVEPEVDNHQVRMRPFRCSMYISLNIKYRSVLPSSFRLGCLSSPSEASLATSKDLALLLEVEGVLADITRSGHRQSFNVAFQKLGLDCANWSEPVYLDLLRKAGGDEERMLTVFFDKIGWPTSLPTNEKELFLKNVMNEKQNALEEFILSRNFSLRPGIEKFIDEALEEGIPVVILASYSRNGESISRHIIQKLGSERIEKVKIVGKEEVEHSNYAKLVLGKGVSSDPVELLANEAARAVVAKKQRVAKEVASLLKLSVDIDTSENEISTARGEFPTAIAVAEGFGPGGLTISRLCRMCSS
eukprot:TRINITY_DN9530_c0_g1_i1.p1 TRINITY_DN9530_c0_g1~~TRINITY_DN9530_c0_g1_i1.p1  ORF type:complete len:345 (+),score=73.23 TRINITY_DN9530_c0_g1_i1:219-1253(+)